METILNHSILGAAAAGGGNMVGTIVMIVVLAAMAYFMIFRPQKKQQQQRQSMMDTIKKGDTVITIGRLHGVIDEINKEDKTFVLDCDGIYLTFDQRAILEVNPGQAPETAEPKKVGKTESAEKTAEAGEVKEAPAKEEKADVTEKETKADDSK